MNRKRAISLSAIFVLFLIQPCMNVSANQSYNEVQSSSYSWLQSIDNSTFFGHDETAKELHIVDLNTMQVLQSVTCSGLAYTRLHGADSAETQFPNSYTHDYWVGGPVRITADWTNVMCSDELYSFNGTTLNNVSSGSFTPNTNPKNGWTLDYTASCNNRNDPNHVITIQNQTTNISNLTITRSGTNAVVLRNVWFYEDDPMKVLIRFNPSDSVTCDTTSTGSVRAITVNLSTTSTVLLSTSTGTSLGNFCGIYGLNFGARVTTCSPDSFGTNTDNEPWFDLDNSNKYDSNAKTRIQSELDEQNKYGFFSAAKNCDIMGINKENGNSVNNIELNGTTYSIPASVNSNEDIQAVTCFSSTNFTFISGDKFYTYWTDTDNDNYNDIVDKFPNDSTQYADQDGDGYGDNPLGNMADACPSQHGTSFEDRYGCTDTDNDGWSNVLDAFPIRPSQWNDTDGDGFGDNQTGFRGDDCPNTFGDSFRNNTYGCIDSDFDGWADSQDHFPNQSSQWNDTDLDGFGDEYSGYQGDECPLNFGNSTIDRFGCEDQDGDGYSDAGDQFPNNPSQFIDSDGDGYGNNQSAGSTQSDAFPSDGTQWEDSDEDGHGDNKYGFQGDHFPNDPTRWKDSDEDGVADEDDAFNNEPTQWSDADGDGYGDNPNGTDPDDFPQNPSEWRDSDGDGYGDNSDEFRFDGSQWDDRDGDGYGDNTNGTNADAFPDDPTRWKDSDGDGIADEDDDFENDPNQGVDSDGDGYGDNPNGSNPDAFPNDPNEWRDGDGDGYGDNSDAFPVDGTQWNDTDGDGHGDNKYGSQGDHFPNDPNRWKDSDEDGVADEDDDFPNDPTQDTDSDGDGYGDNQDGNNPDAYPADPTEWEDSDNDGVGDNFDEYSFNPTQIGDSDGDGYGDNANGSNGDAFPNDPTQWSDIDGDGYGDNPNGTTPDAFPIDATQWSDDDGDGYGDNPNGRNLTCSLTTLHNSPMKTVTDLGIINQGRIQIHHYLIQTTMATQTTLTFYPSYLVPETWMTTEYLTKMTHFQRITENQRIATEMAKATTQTLTTTMTDGLI